MRPVRRTYRQLRRTLCLCLPLFCSVALAGCGPADPVQPIREQLAQGRYQEALEPLRELLAEPERRHDPELQYLYGLALTQAGQPSLAEWALRAAMDDPKWLVPAGTQLANGALTTQNFGLAIEAANRVLEVEPDNVAMLVMRANAHAHSRLDPEAALEDVDRALAIDPDNIEAMEPKILALLALERIDEAGAAIDELGERIEKSGAGSAMAGWHCATAALFADESDEMELAAERWADCVERFPGHLNVVTNALPFYDRRGQRDRSMAILRRALEENPDARELRVMLGERLRMAGKPAEAEALLLEATERAPGPLAETAAWLDLSKHYQEVEDYDASAQAAGVAYERSRQIGEAHPQVLLEYADALIMAGRLEEASAIADDMTLPAYREMVRARIAQRAGRPAEALQHFDEAFRYWPDNPFARFFAGLAAESVGDFDRAIDAYRYAIRIAPGATDARVRVARLDRAEGRLVDALHLLRMQADQQPLSVEGELLSLYLFARTGQNEKVTQGVAAFARALPQHLGEALAEVAEGLRDRLGPEPAVRYLRQAVSAGGVDLTDPRNVHALRALVRYSLEAGQREAVEATVARVVERHPDATTAHEAQGLLLELAGGAEDASRAAYERAVELDPANLRALRGLGRLAGDEPERALATFDRVLAQDQGDREALLGSAEALKRMGRPQEAQARLEALLTAEPSDAAAAAALAELDLEADAVSDRSIALAERAVRFGGGVEALELLSRLHAKRGEAEAASRAAERARALRDRLGG